MKQMTVKQYMSRSTLISGLKATQTFPVGTLRKAIRDAFPMVETVSDATTSIVVEVGHADRNRAVPHDPTCCAMAIATKRQYEADGVWIGLTRSYVRFGTHLFRFATPQSLAREIVAFDRHEDFASGTYRLSCIGANTTQRLGSQHTRTSGNNDGSRPQPKGVTLPKHFTTRVRGAA